MMGWQVHNEAVEVVDKRFAFFPQALRWRGRFYEVDSVERCWTVLRRGWWRRADRRHFLVQCTSGSFELYQDLENGTWHLRRVLVHPARVAGARRLAAAWRSSA
jgi:hypothetical protein